MIFGSPAQALAASERPAPLVPARTWDPSEDPPIPVLDRAFPLDQCAPIPVNAIYLSTGPHNHTPGVPASAAPRAGWYVPAPDGSATL